MPTYPQLAMTKMKGSERKGRAKVLGGGGRVVRGSREEVEGMQEVQWDLLIMGTWEGRQGII